MIDRKYLTTAMTCLAILGGTGLAIAGTVDKSEQAEIGGVRIAGVAPANAIRTAQQNAGGRALSFGYEVDGTTNAYEITVSTDKGLQMVQVDPQSGKVLSTRPQDKGALQADGLPASEVDRAGAAKTDLATAVESVEQMTGGRALEAGYAVAQGKLGVDVDIAREGRIASFIVDASDGKVTRLASAEDESAEAAEDGDND